MTSAISARLQRLEKDQDMGNPYAHLSDAQLDARLRDLTSRIEEEAGMPLADYAASLLAALEDGEEVPTGWTESQVRNFAAALQRYGTNAH